MYVHMPTMLYLSICINVFIASVITSVVAYRKCWFMSRKRNRLHSKQQWIIVIIWNIEDIYLICKSVYYWIILLLVPG